MAGLGRPGALAGTAGTPAMRQIPPFGFAKAVSLPHMGGLPEAGDITQLPAKGRVSRLQQPGIPSREMVTGCGRGLSHEADASL
jgi:hypothetical protein